VEFFFILKITLRFIQPLKKVKLCKIANFPLTDTLRGTDTAFLTPEGFNEYPILFIVTTYAASDGFD